VILEYPVYRHTYIYMDLIPPASFLSRLLDLENISWLGHIILDMGNHTPLHTVLDEFQGNEMKWNRIGYNRMLETVRGGSVVRECSAMRYSCFFVLFPSFYFLLAPPIIINITSTVGIVVLYEDKGYSKGAE